MHLEHVNLTVNSVPRSIDFYRNLLNLDLRWEGTNGSGRRAAHIGDDRSYLALFEAAEPSQAVEDYSRTGLNHIGFVVDDLDEMKARLIRLGVEPHQEEDYEPGKRLYFYDLNGIEVELVEYPQSA